MNATGIGPGIFRQDLLAGRRVLITGGGSGLGQAIAERAVSLGAQVFICGRREETLASAAAGMAGLGPHPVRFLCCDVREPDQVASLMEEIWRDGPLDILVNNAAAAMLARTNTLSARAFDAVLRTTLQGVVYATLEAGRRWIDAGHRGTILSTIASGVELGRPFMVPLTVAKGGVLTLTRSLAQEWGPKGIRVLAIGPGSIATRGAAARLGTGRDPTDSIPLRRMGQPGEIAELAVFLMSEGAGFITGEMITIDGGRGLAGPGNEHLFNWTDEQWAALRAKPKA